MEGTGPVRVAWQCGASSLFISSPGFINNQLAWGTMLSGHSCRLGFLNVLAWLDALYCPAIRTGLASSMCSFHFIYMSCLMVSLFIK
jgi:hypothetical protein